MPNHINPGVKSRTLNKNFEYFLSVCLPVLTLHSCSYVQTTVLEFKSGRCAGDSKLAENINTSDTNHEEGHHVTQKSGQPTPVALTVMADLSEQLGFSSIYKTRSILST